MQIWVFINKMGDARKYVNIFGFEYFRAPPISRKIHIESKDQKTHIPQSFTELGKVSPLETSHNNSRASLLSSGSDSFCLLKGPPASRMGKLGSFVASPNGDLFGGQPSLPTIRKGYA